LDLQEKVKKILQETAYKELYNLYIPPNTVTMQYTPGHSMRA
jgi:hypothetical protein